jgi:hypothetical protein
VCLVVGVKLNVTWCSLWSRPERRALLINMVFREDAEQVKDGVVVVGVEAFFGDSDTVIESVRLFHLDKVYNLLQFCYHT